MITLRQLRYFHALAETLHFGRAARDCAVTQPALSMQIKELEAALGVSLIERRKSGVQLTGTGREVAKRAARVLLDVQELQGFATNRHGPLGRTLSLGVIPTIAPYFLPLALPELQARHPDIELTLHEAQTDRLLALLADGTLDVALLALPAGDRRFRSEPLFEDRFLLAMPPRTEAPDPVAMQDLPAESLILLEEGHCLRDQALAVCGAVGSSVMSRFGATSLTTILQMVGNGYGSTLVPEMAVPVEIGAGAQLTMRHLTPEQARTVGLIWRASAPRQERFEHLGEVLRGVRRRERKPRSAA